METGNSANGRVDRSVRPRAWIRMCSDGGYEGPIADCDKRMDAVRRSSGAWTPLYAPDDFVADVIGLDNMRELCALLVDLDNIEDPERVPFPAIDDRDWRAHARKCSNAIRLLMRRIVGSGPNAKVTGSPALSASPCGLPG